MISLIIDTSSSVNRLWIVADESIIAYKSLQLANDASAKILPYITEMFDEVKLSIKEIDNVQVCNGPGSFTGIRTGIVIAKIVAWSLNIPIYSFSHLELLASKSGKIIAVIKDRNQKVYLGMYNNLQAICKDRLISEEEFNKIKKKNKDYEIVETEDEIDVLNLARVNIKKPKINPHHLNPIYLKMTQAEKDLVIKNEK